MSSFHELLGYPPFHSSILWAVTQIVLEIWLKIWYIHDMSFTVLFNKLKIFFKKAKNFKMGMFILLVYLQKFMSYEDVYYLIFKFSGPVVRGGKGEKFWKIDNFISFNQKKLKIRQDLTKFLNVSLLLFRKDSSLYELCPN